MLTISEGCITFEGETGPPYTAYLKDVEDLAGNVLPMPMDWLHEAIKRRTIRAHIHYESPGYENDVTPEEVTSGLAALVVITALEREWEELHYDASIELGGARCNDNFTRKSHLWTCTLPRGHGGPEHIAHFGRAGKLVSCCRWIRKETK